MVVKTGLTVLVCCKVDVEIPEAEDCQLRGKMLPLHSHLHTLNVNCHITGGLTKGWYGHTISLCHFFATNEYPKPMF